MTPAQVSLIMLIVSIIALPFALGAYVHAKRADQASDDLIDASTHYDVRTLNLLNPPHKNGPSA